MTREYYIKLTSNDRTIYKEKFETLEKCCDRIFSDFVNLNIADSILDNIKLEKTTCFKNDYYKTITIENYMPNLKYYIKKLSAGDISLERVEELLKLKKEKYNERAYNKFRH